MKPQIVALEYGEHNKNLEKTAAKLMRGGSWKKQRVIVLIPAGDMVSTKVALSWRGIVFPPNQAVHWMGALGMEVGEAYSNSIEMILSHPELSQWEYLLTLEHDNIVPGDAVVKLIEDMENHPEFACIGGLYFTKGEGGVAQIWGDPRDPVMNFRPQVPIPDQLVECCGTGMGCNLWRLSMFKDERLRRPWFKTLKGDGGVATQDLYAWQDFRNHGYRCAIDCNVRVGHLEVANDICW